MAGERKPHLTLWDGVWVCWQRCAQTGLLARHGYGPAPWYAYEDFCLRNGQHGPTPPLTTYLLAEAETGKE